MDEICKKSARFMQDLCKIYSQYPNENARNMQNFARIMQEIIYDMQENVHNMQEISKNCKKRARNLQEICSLCKSWHQYAKYARGTLLMKAEP